MRINKYSDVMKDPQTLAMQWVQPLTLPNGVATRTVVTPLKFDNQAAPISRRPPRLGEHSAEILGALG